MHYVSRVLAIIALIVICIFAVQNLEAVDVRFLMWSVSISKVIVILLTYVLGMVTGWGIVEVMKRSMAK
jgi:putative membrane protein